MLCSFALESSDGIRLEYVAIFLATLFPGALVAFDYDLLRASPRFTSLRVYCAGIWHNAVVSLLPMYYCIPLIPYWLQLHYALKTFLLLIAYRCFCMYVFSFAHFVD